MSGKFYSWRYYSYGHEQYHECMGKVFVHNLTALHQINLMFAIFSASLIVFPIFIENLALNNEKAFINMAVYLVSALIAFVSSFYLHYRIQSGEVSNRFIYIFITLFYVNLMAFGIYLGVWSNPPGTLATLFLCFLIWALLMFINPPIFNLCLTLGAVAIFITCSIIVKKDYPEAYLYDIANASLAGVLALFFSWHITKLRLGMEISSSILEDERNKFLDQSIIDELTKLNNRRDFMATFKRYLSNYRNSDDFLCVAISDIDFFKNYNDHYGHPQGDKCLRSIGTVFNSIKESKGVYAARVGGEEFAMLWFEQDASHVDAVVTHMSDLIRDLKIPHAKSKVSEYVTMSMGVYIERLGESTDVNTLYELADNALYAAKGSGRKCAIINGREIKQYKIAPSA